MRRFSIAIILGSLVSSLAHAHGDEVIVSQSSPSNVVLVQNRETEPVPSSVPVLNEVWMNEPSYPAGGAVPYAQTECLLWWVKGAPVPPLITASTPGTPRIAAGVLGDPRTTILFGGERAANDLRFGGRFTLGTWLDTDRTWAIETNFFILEGQADIGEAGSDGTAIIARPFFNAFTNALASELVSFPNVLAGTVTASASSSGLFGTELLARRTLRETYYEDTYEPSRIQFLVGCRFLKLDEGINVDEDLSPLPGNGLIPPGTRINVHDSFLTHNQFFGGEIGLAGEMRRGRLVVGAVGKVALGVNHSVVEIDGSTQVSVPGAAPISNVGGLLALPTNIGRNEQNGFAFVPEVGLNVGYQVTPGIQVFAGYTFLYWTRVARPGDQIDLNVNPTQLPPGTLVGAPSPVSRFNVSDIWAQGLQLGASISF